MNVTSGKPRVLYVITKATWGGAQRYVYDLIAAAHSRGLSPSLAFGEPGMLSERVAALGYPVHQVPSLGRDPSLGGDLRAVRELASLFRNERPDVVHLNSSKAGFLGALAGRIAGVSRIVFTAHGWAFTEPRSPFSRAVFLLFHYLTALLSSRTIAVSEAVLRHARRWPFVQHKMSAIPLGITLPHFLSRSEARTALSAQDPRLASVQDQPWVGTIAELHKNKGLDIGIEAWKRSSVHAQWVVLGGGEEEQTLRAQAANVSSIHFLGFTSDAAAYLKAFDLFVLPSRTEAFGYVLLEAGAAGLPVLASRVGGIPEVVHDPASLFPVGDPAELAERLASLLNDPADLARRGAAFHDRVVATYALASMIERTFSQYA